MPYRTTVSGVMNWVRSELAHVGRITAIEDPDIQYAYAMSTVNGMLHLRKALEEMVSDKEYASQHADLRKTHDGVVRVIKHLIKDHAVDIDTIKAFNTRHIFNSNNLNMFRSTMRNNKNGRKSTRKN